MQHIGTSGRHGSRRDSNGSPCLVGIKSDCPEHGQGGAQPVQIVEPSKDPGCENRNPAKASGPKDGCPVVELPAQAGRQFLYPSLAGLEFCESCFRFRASTAAGQSGGTAVRTPNEVLGVTAGFELHRSAEFVSCVRTRFTQQLETIPRIHGIADAVSIYLYDIVNLCQSKPDLMIILAKTFHRN